MAEKVKRVYGVEKGLGDILYNKETKEIYAYINLGFFGSTKVVLTKNESETYDLSRVIYKDGEYSNVRLGKTFKATNRDGDVVDGITQGTLGLGSFYDSEEKVNKTDTKDAIYITTHKLKDTQQINDKITKLGYIKGRFGIEVEVKEGEEETKTESPKKETKVKETKTESPKKETPTSEPKIPEIDIDDDEIPF